MQPSRPDVPGLAHRLTLIQQSGTALLTVVNDILDFSKIEAGLIQIEKVPFSPHTLVDNGDPTQNRKVLGQRTEIEVVGRHRE